MTLWLFLLSLLFLFISSYVQFPETLHSHILSLSSRFYSFAFTYSLSFTFFSLFSVLSSSFLSVSIMSCITLIFFICHFSFDSFGHVAICTIFILSLLSYLSFALLMTAGYFRVWTYNCLYYQHTRLV